MASVQAPGERRRQAVGDGLRLDPDRRAGVEGESHRVRALRLDPVDPRRRPDLPDRGRDARDQPAATDRHDDDVDVRQVLEDLEPGRAVAGDQLRVVERVHERQAALGREPLLLGEHLADVAAVDDDLGAVVTAGVELRADRGLGHDHRRRHADRPGRPRARLGRVARGDRDDPRRPLRVGRG